MSDKTKSLKSLKSMFSSGFVERHDLEQYFWTEETVQRIINAIKEYTDCCCLTTPSLAHALHIEGKEEALFDIDTRFDYLPKFRYYDINKKDLDTVDETFRIVVFDPPFFYIEMEQMFKAVMKIVNNNTKTKLLIGFLKREEKSLMQHFGVFGIKPTNFQLNYATVKPNKWKNYCLYSNIDLPGIKRKN